MTGTDAADVVVFVLVDACRHDYVSRTRFLRGLAAAAIEGAVEEPFGFCPRAAYFGGLTMAAQGFTNVFRYDPARSPFAWVRHVASGNGIDDRIAGVARERIRSTAREALPPFAAAYADPARIPLHALASFDLSEQHAPWDRCAGYRSLFHILDDDGRSWMEVSWPYQGWRGPLTNRRVAGEALGRLDSSHRFAFIHLPELDAVGHGHGPGSRAVQDALDETDALCGAIHAAVVERFADPVIVFAGDHGMLPVVRTVDPIAAIAATGLRWGHDVTYFVDSTMVRCWYATASAREATRASLDAAGGGRWLEQADFQRWHLAGIDSRTGDDYFLADPGVVFSPSFFDAADAPPRGMHGYAPDVADNRGALVIDRPRARRRGHAGVVQARRLFPSFLEWLGYEPASFTDAMPIGAIASDRPRPWSTAGTPASDALVERHLAAIAGGVRAAAPEAEAILVAGGFGRGEGTISTSTGQPANDYDVVIVTSESERVVDLGPALAGALAIDFVDLWPRADLAPLDPVSQFDFDLRYGSRVLWGDPLAVDRLPLHAPAELSADEGAFQIGNRSGGLLLALTGRGADSRDGFLGRQHSKFLIAIADAWLMAVGDYHSSYAVRRDRFGALAGAAGFQPAVVAAIDRAFAAKLEGIPDETLGLDGALTSASLAVRELDRVLDDEDDEIAIRATRVADRRIRPDGRWADRLAGFGLALRDRDASADQAAGAVYRACIAAVREWSRGGCAASATAARHHLRALDATSLDDVNLLRATGEAWLALFH